MTRIVQTRLIDDDKLGIVHDDKLRRVWASEHNRCQLCGDGGSFPRWLETHHLSGAAGRSDERCNFARLCNGDGGCHGLYHAGLIRFETVMAAKLLCDPEEFDLCRVLRLRRQAMSAELYLDIALEASRMLKERNQ